MSGFLQSLQKFQIGGANFLRRFALVPAGTLTNQNRIVVEGVDATRDTITTFIRAKEGGVLSPRACGARVWLLGTKCNKSRFADCFDFYAACFVLFRILHTNSIARIWTALRKNRPTRCVI